ncbi:putative pre-mRNA splicing factor [Aspergillus novofumigatus IBT 16806]|uniref:HhH-GPD domain-containing protein n=1 Tax=Aspergillus novofumigatus (strain IBT 16806) TaxID=1392255 RepID=A0A2I1BZF1_ASPN1|nr:uncharacterized protein P174DRAFT_394450 [Aspergillus novofumigatus IBT 16806]PKX90770.1 hypothetical protein P174DRAFT_394450 [Aspergillus novofumigatus IBT 16806]
MSPHTVSVVISPPTVDLDSYEPFDEEYIRTVDEILSDEPSFDASFDAYNSGISTDGANDSPQRERGTSRASVGKGTGRTHKKSPYFSTGQMSQRRIGSKRSIPRIDVDGDDGDKNEDDNEDDLTPATSVESVKIQVADNNIGNEHHNNKTYAKANGDAVEDDITEEDIVFASVGPEAQARLLDFIASHSFMRGGSYPVRRSKRRTFVCELYEQAKSTGMDEHSIDRLTNYVRKTYLELYGKDYGDTQGSEFGDEIDDVAGERRSSSKVSKKERKRKRSNGDTAKQKPKKSRSQSSQSSEEKRTTSIADSHTDPKREVIDLEAEYPLEDFASATEHEVLESISPAEELPKRRPSISKQSDRSSKHNRSNGFTFVTPEKRNNRASALSSSKQSLRSPANSKDEPICLESDSDGPKKSTTAAPVAHLANPIFSDRPETRKESIAAPRKEKNHRKRQSRRKRRAEKHRESLQDSEIQELAADDRHIEKDATTKKFDRENGVTASDEVKSKYFRSPQQVDGLASSSQISATYSANYVRDYKHIPEETRQILTEFGLPFDFLDSDSDSDLSDVPSDDSILDHDAFLWGVIQPHVRDETFVRPAEGIPRTPLKKTLSAEPDVPFVMTLRPRPPKVSPYFPKPLIDPDSCLPFPSIDAPTFGLVQEQLAHDPFRLLIATIFLNRTRGGVALPVLFRVFDHFPTVHDMSTADFWKLLSMIRSLGFQNERAKKCIDLAKTWLARPPTKGRRYRRLHYPRKLDGKDVGREECIGDDEDDTRVAWEIAHLPGVGPYSLDSWRIFCRDELRGLAKDWKGNGAASADFEPEWKSVLPQDKELRAYLTWMWLKEGWVWDRHTGKRKRASEKMMRAARRGGVAQEQDGNFVLEMSPVKRVANGLTAWS